MIKNKVISTPRQGIPHFQKMKPEDFILWLRNTNGILRDIKIVMKIDGLGARFGKCVDGRIFFEGSRTGPVFDSGAFSDYVKDKTQDIQVITRAVHYDNMLEIFKGSIFMSSIPLDCKVICEIFYNPMAITEESRITFVTVKYDKSKLGSLMTIMPYSVIQSSTGLDHPDSLEILEKLYSCSGDIIKFIDPNLNFDQIDVLKFVKRCQLFNYENLNILKSKKNRDSIVRQHLKEIIQEIKNDLAEYLLYHSDISDKYKLGPEIEGIVLHIPNKDGIISPFKIISEKFYMAHKVDKYMR